MSAPHIPAVDPVTRELNYTSVSSLTKFNSEEYGGCPRRWWFKAVERLKEKQTEKQAEGVAGHAQLEHYLTTNEDVLGAIAAAGRHLLPAPGKDLLVEFGLNGQPKPAVKPGEREFYPPSESLLHADGVPLIGFMDLVNPRGEYVSPEGLLISEPNTWEVVDHKFKGNAGYAATPDQLRESTQIVGYAEFIRLAGPEELEFVRASHITYQTRDARRAVKTTVRLGVDEIEKNWQRVGHDVAKRMREIAAIRKEGDVPVCLESCNAYRKLCDFAPVCSAYKGQKPLEKVMSSYSKQSTPNNEVQQMAGLLDRVRGLSGGTPPPPPANGAAAGQVFAPPPPPGPLTAKDATSGATYKFSTGAVGMFLSAVSQAGGPVTYSFLQVIGGKPGSEPFQVASTEAIEFVAPPAPPAPPAAAVAGPPAPPAPPAGNMPWVPTTAAAPVAATATGALRRLPIQDAPTPPAPEAPVAEAPKRPRLGGKKAEAAAQAAAPAVSAVARVTQIQDAIKTAHEVYAELYGAEPTFEQALPIWQALLG